MPVPKKALLLVSVALLTFPSMSGQTVYVSRMWHNHQPLYWPEWNTNGSETNRVEYAWDSISLKPNRSYPDSNAQHPENNLSDIFGLDDRQNAYQAGPRNSLANLPQSAGFCMSYSGSLIDNIRQLGGGSHLGYGSGWAEGNREAAQWLTPSGSRRLDLVGFTYHHSLSPLLPKEVFRKEIQIFKQAWWKAWGGNSDLSDHSKGFFPTEMAFSRHMVDVLVDEGYDWSIVASHHLSRTCPTYFNQFDLANGNYGIYSSPPNKADLLGPSPTTGWWYSEPNPGNAAWNVSPFAYQLHRSQYINPETGATKDLIMVPSDDVLSYRYGYANEGISKIQNQIAPFANDSSRPVLVMPATDGDNAWGGGSSSWFEATPQLFNESATAGYQPTAVQDFVNTHGAAAPVTHIEDGAWIFPESCYGSPYFLKWIEPPVAAAPVNRYPNTVVDMESPGFALKFWAWAPVITGANWVETAEQILEDEGSSVESWKIQAPYDWDGTPTNPNEVELAWHIYLGGLDSGFNYYGGLGNDDEVKAALATTRAIEKLDPWMTATRRANDRTPPSVLKPQRFPHNPGGMTFGWFNSIPGGDTNYLKQMPSEFYIWTHAYDLSGLSSVNLKIRVDADGVNSMASTDNETYAGGSEVGAWTTLAMTKRELPNTSVELNAASDNGQINYFVSPPELADYYFSKIDESSLPGFKDKLLDYYIEATDSKGNVHKSEIQHVFVEDSEVVVNPPPGGETVVVSPEEPDACALVTISYDPSDTVLDGASQVYIHLGRNGWEGVEVPRPAMTFVDGKWTHTFDPADDSEVLNFVFTNGADEDASIWDNNGGNDWQVACTPCLEPGVEFVLDGTADSEGFKQVDNPSLPLYAAVRGNLLYLATKAPSDGNDHFLMLAESVLAIPNNDAPWAKAGSNVFPLEPAFVGSESDNDYAGWFNTTASTGPFRNLTSGSMLEATIDLGEHFGSMPSQVCLAALAYGTDDGSSLALQAPLAETENDDVENNEVLCLDIEAIRDEDGDGIYDTIVVPETDLELIDWSLGATQISLTVTTANGSNYQLQGSLDLDEWDDLGSIETATAAEHEFTTSRTGEDTYFLRVKKVD